ncbi:DUF3788 family protein [Bowmanella sp. Y26]|uniref:DUF3788 family protein n=1 Tax=Bowmanella yangjiangensis TaxID=2811230 RepID=UPI001BDC87F5|nr:DUF3788 family protein [Bowmanella yangjiangensis]MBT1063547.1 DUF3788 family protein [Bowmanella yangjiangensis]
METINKIELADQQVFPSETVLAGILGDSSYQAYLMLLKRFEQLALSVNWRYYPDGGAWLCKVQFKRRTIVWMSAWKGFMQATLYVPKKCLEDVLALDIAEATRARILATQNVGQSKPCIVDITNSAAVDECCKLMKYKIAT